MDTTAIEPDAMTVKGHDVCLTLAFSAYSEQAQGEGMTPFRIKLALLRRMADLDASAGPQRERGEEWLEAVLPALDSEATDETREAWADRMGGLEVIDRSTVAQAMAALMASVSTNLTRLETGAHPERVMSRMIEDAVAIFGGRTPPNVIAA